MRFPESVSLLIDLVAVASPTRQEADAARMLADRLPRFGWETSHLDGAGSVVAARGNGDRELLLLSHIDTVPGGPAFFVDEERIVGRGSVDAKSPCCALAVGGGAVNIPDGWRITFVAAVGEEIDSRGARFRMPLHEPAALIVGEPTGSGGIALSYRGRILFSYTAEDSGAHRSGSPGPMTDTVMAAASLTDITKNMGKGYTIAVMDMEGHEAGGRSALLPLCSQQRLYASCPTPALPAVPERHCPGRARAWPFLRHGAHEPMRGSMGVRPGCLSGHGS